MKKESHTFIVSLILPFIAGALGSYLTIDAIPGWYQTLNKPSFTPPNWIFAPVWIVLYLFMGISLFLFWRMKASKHTKDRGFLFYSLQLALNVLWSYYFFTDKNVSSALFVILLLWLFIALCIGAFRKISVLAAWLLVPYLLWVTYAACLNAAILLLN